MVNLEADGIFVCKYKIGCLNIYYNPKKIVVKLSILI